MTEIEFKLHPSSDEAQHPSSAPPVQLAILIRSLAVELQMGIDHKHIKPEDEFFHLAGVPIVESLIEASRMLQEEGLSRYATAAEAMLEELKENYPDAYQDESEED